MIIQQAPPIAVFKTADDAAASMMPWSLESLHTALGPYQRLGRMQSRRAEIGGLRDASRGPQPREISEGRLAGWPSEWIAVVVSSNEKPTARCTAAEYSASK